VDNRSLLDDVNYTSRGFCIANSSNVTLSSSFEQINASMTASVSTSWYAKVSSVNGVCSIMRENVTFWNKTYNGRGSTDIASCVALSSNDDSYVVGLGVNLNSSGTQLDWWIMKFNSIGS